jgi:hypothetical protein
LIVVPPSEPHAATIGAMASAAPQTASIRHRI